MKESSSGASEHCKRKVALFLPSLESGRSSSQLPWSRKLTDFFLVEGDPLADLSQLRKVTTTVRAGTLHDSAELYRAVGVRP